MTESHSVNAVLTVFRLDHWPIEINLWQTETVLQLNMCSKLYVKQLFLLYGYHTSVISNALL